MDAIANKYSYQATVDKSAFEEAEQEVLGDEFQSGIPSISLPPIDRVCAFFFSFLLSKDNEYDIIILFIISQNINMVIKQNILTNKCLSI